MNDTKCQCASLILATHVATLLWRQHLSQSAAHLVSAVVQVLPENPTVFLLWSQQGLELGQVLNADHCFGGQGVSSCLNQHCSCACPFFPTHHWSVLLQHHRLPGQRLQTAKQGVGREVSVSGSLCLTPFGSPGDGRLSPACYLGASSSHSHLHCWRAWYSPGCSQDRPCKHCRQNVLRALTCCNTSGVITWICGCALWKLGSRRGEKSNPLWVPGWLPCALIASSTYCATPGDLDFSKKAASLDEAQTSSA